MEIVVPYRLKLKLWKNAQYTIHMFRFDISKLLVNDVPVDFKRENDSRTNRKENTRVQIVGAIDSRILNRLKTCWIKLQV